MKTIKMKLIIKLTLIFYNQLLIEGYKIFLKNLEKILELIFLII